MSAPFVPFRLDDGGNFHLEKLNGDLRKIARDIKLSQDQRYTYWETTFDLDGVTNALAPVLRQFAVRRPGANNGLEILGYELVIYAAAAATWTCTCSDATIPATTLATLGATTEAKVSQGIPITVPSNAADVTFTLACATASTITRGYLVVHYRTDRWNEGQGSFAPYTPQYLTSLSWDDDVAATLQAELDAASTAVVADTSAAGDFRCELFVARNVASGTTLTFRLPSGAGRTKFHARGYQVAAVGTNVQFNVDASSFTVNGAGPAVLATGSAALAGTTPDDPMNSANDTVVTFVVSGGGTCLLAYLYVWWS